MTKIMLKSLQNYAKRKELHVVDSAEVDLSLPQSDDATPPGAEPSSPVMGEEDQETKVEEREEDWEDLDPEPVQSKEPKRRKYQMRRTSSIGLQPILIYFISGC